MSLSNDAINPEHETAPEGVVPELVNEVEPTQQLDAQDEQAIQSKGTPQLPNQAKAVSELNDDAERKELEEHSAAIGVEKEKTEGNDVESEDEVDGGLEGSERGEEVEEMGGAEIEPASVEMAGSASEAAMEQRLLEDQQAEAADGNEDLITGDTAAKDDGPISADREAGDALTDQAISRTASPASNTSAGQVRPSSTSASVPKKFSSVNINKKFLGKTAVVAPTATAPNFGGLGMKPVGTLGSLGARPSSSPSGSQTSSSRILTSVKLTKTSSASASPASSSVTPPPMGWSRPTIDAAKAKADGPSEPTSSGLGNLRKPMSSSNQHGPMGLSLGLLGNKRKKGWGSVPEQGRTGSVLPGSSKEFPTAKEVVEGQRQAALHAQMAAQAQAAHHQALLQGLDSFRSRKRDDPNVHYWDEDDDEGNFDQVLDFGDGTTYTIPAALPQEALQPLESDRQHEEPVTKEQRFADDFDRSWPPKQQVAPPFQPPRGHFDGRDAGREAAMAQQARVLFNERSNKLETPSGGERPRKQPPPPTQLLTRTADLGRSGPGRAGPPSGFDRAPPPHLAAQDHAPPGPLPGLARREPPPHIGGGSDRAPARELPPHAPQQPVPHTHLPLGSLAMGNRRESQHAESMQRPTGLHSMPPGPQRQPEPPRSANAASSWRNDALAFDKSSVPLQPQVEIRSPPRQVAPLALPTLPPAPPQPSINLTNMQKDEMHSAAERAKARREAEEAEREAQKDRARRKAKELEERMKGLAAPEPAVVQAPPPSDASAAPRRTTLLQRPQRPESQQDTILQRSVGLPPPQWDGAAPRPSVPPPHRVINQGAQPSAFAPLRPSAEAIASRSRGNEQMVQIDSRVSTERPVAISPTSPVQSRGDRPQAIAAAALKSVRPEILERSTWRRSAEGTAKEAGRTLQADGPSYDREVSSSYLQPTPTNGLKRSPVLSPATEAATTGASVVSSGLPPPGIPPIEQNRSTVMPQTPSSKSQPKEPSSTSFDDIMARIKSVMVNEQEQRKTALEASPSKEPSQSQLPPTQPQPQESPLPIRARNRASAPAAAPPPRPTSPPFIPGPRPANFLTTRSPTPEVPPPAWKTQMVKLPRTSRPPHSISRTARLNTLPAPPDFLISWEPPLAQLSPNTLSRDEIFIGQKYFRGRLVTIVKLPPPHALRWLQPEVEADLPLDMSETSEPVQQPQTEQQPMIASGPRKVVVRLPTGSRSGGALPAETASDLETPESTDLLPIPANDTPPALSRQKSPRRVDTGNAVSFAKPQPLGAGSDIKTSVRFLMESQLEENASKELLDEVLQTSQDAMDGPLEEEEAQPLTPAFPKALEKKMDAAAVSPTSKSGPTSPTTTTSGKRSNVYPLSQSPGRVVDRNHIKSVWSQTASNDVGSSSNSLEGIADELPQFSMPMQDLPEGKDEPEATETKDVPNGGQEDLDIPQFASVGAVQAEAALSPGVANGYAAYPIDPRMLNQSQSPYGQISSPLHGQSPTSSYQYPAGGNGMAPQYSGSGYSGTPLSAQTPNQYMGVHRIASDGSGVQQSSLSMHGIPGQLQHQMGVWMPASQHQNGSMQSGAGSTGLYTASGTQKLGRPGSTMSDYRGMNHGQDPLYGAAASSMGSGIYSNATGGPLDSPVASFARPYAAPATGTGQYGMNMGYGGAGGPIGYGSGGQRYQPSSGGAGGIGQRNMYGSVNPRGGPYAAGNGGDYNPAVGSSTYQHQVHGQIGRGSGSQSTGYGHMEVGKGVGGGSMGGSSPQRPGMGIGSQHQRHASGGGMGGRSGFMRGSGGVDRGPW